jgi:hypothetical protein
VAEWQRVVSSKASSDELCPLGLIGVRNFTGVVSTPYCGDVQGYRALKSDSSTRIVVPGSGSKGAQWIKGEPDFEYSMSVKS